MSLIRLNDVSMEFDGRPVLREAFLKLRRGDRVGLIGKNGTGKTTFLELVLGRQEPSGGTVDVSLGTTIGSIATELRHLQRSEVGEVR